MSPNLTEAKEPSIEMPELIADREVIVKKPGKESFFTFWVDLKQLSVQIRQKSRTLKIFLKLFLCQVQVLDT